MGELRIRVGPRQQGKTITDASKDQLKTDELNALEGPLIAVLAGGFSYPVHDIEPVIAHARLDVCGQLDIVSFATIMKLIDINGVEHDPEDFWHD